MTSPQFLYIVQNLHRLHWQRGKQEICFGIAAAMGDAEHRQALLKCAKDWVIVKDGSSKEFTPEMLEKAKEKALKIVRK